MFCSNCGAKARGNFCSQCGASLQSDSEECGAPLQSESEEVLVAQLADWSHEICYAQLLKYPEIRDRIAAAAKRYSPQMTGEELLATFDALVPTGISLQTLTKILQPLYGRLGIKTGQSSREQFAAPPGRVLVAALCSLAARGIELLEVRQAESACVLEATIPSNVWSFAGQLLVTVHGGGRETCVEAAVKITGQLYDWGKSKRALNHLFADIRGETRLAA